MYTLHSADPATTLPADRIIAPALAQIRQIARNIGLQVDDANAPRLRVALLWDDTIVAERTFIDPAPISIGESDRAMFQLPTGGIDLHTLLTPERGGWWLTVPEGATGSASTGELTAMLTPGVKVWFEAGDTGTIRFENGVQLVFGTVTLPLRKVVLAWSGDGRLATSWALSAAILLGLLLTALLSERPKLRVPVQEELARHTMYAIELTETEQREEVEPPAPILLSPDYDTSGERANDEEGKTGDLDKPVERETRIPRKADVLPDDLDFDVNDIGLVQKLKQAMGASSDLGTILAGPTTDLESKLAVVGNDDGTERQIGHGAGGMGFRKTGGGGGGDGHGLRALGKLHTGGGTGRIGLKGKVRIAKGRSRRVDKIDVEHLKTSGFCVQGKVAKAVRRRATALRGCYETRLLSRPTLAGRIDLMWTIDLQGEVVRPRAINDTVDDVKVTDCVRRVISRIRFTKPEGGVCVIRWPLVFTHG